MPRRHQRSGCRNQWSDEQLQAALEAVRSGKMKAHAAALKFCIPSSTLYDYLKGKSRRRYGGHPTILTCAEEKEIATSCQILQKFPLTKDIVGIIVRDYITQQKREKKASKGRKKEKTPTVQDQSEADVDAGSDGKQ